MSASSRPLRAALCALAAIAFYFFGRSNLPPRPALPPPATATVPELAPVEAEEQPAEAPQAAPPPKKAPAGKPWQRLDGCTWEADRWNDGDSFHILTGSEPPEIVARLYFVDTPEAETAYRDRIAEQAAYFGITKEQAVDIAHEAAAFTEKQLAAPFTVWTRWNSALGRSALGRVYCVILTKEGDDLAELLVANGLARIYGVKTVLYDGRDSQEYLAHLGKLETKAKAAKIGGWRFATATATPKPAQTVSTTPPAASLAGGCVASKNSAVFHKPECKSVPTIFPANLVKFGSREEATAAGKKPCAICKP